MEAEPDPPNLADEYRIWFTVGALAGYCASGSVRDDANAAPTVEEFLQESSGLHLMSGEDFSEKTSKRYLGVLLNSFGEVTTVAFERGLQFARMRPMHTPHDLNTFLSMVKNYLAQEGEESALAWASKTDTYVRDFTKHVEQRREGASEHQTTADVLRGAPEMPEKGRPPLTVGMRHPMPPRSAREAVRRAHEYADTVDPPARTDTNRLGEAVRAVRDRQERGWGLRIPRAR